MPNFEKGTKVLKVDGKDKGLTLTPEVNLVTFL